MFFCTGTLVGDVSVEDYDAGVNAEYDLRLVSQGPQSDFILQDGQIKTTASLDREALDTYYIILEATDRGTPSLVGTGTVTIMVLDDNDNVPYFNTTYEVGNTFLYPDSFLNCIIYRAQRRYL